MLRDRSPRPMQIGAAGDLRNLRKLTDDDGLMRETFTLPLNAARLMARQILDEHAARGYVAVVENWRQLPDGQIEFTMRRLPTAV